jgi:putative addiction module component (TIGR02574 family)
MLPFDDVYEAALALPRSQRAELIELLTSDLASDDETAFDFAWKEEQDERSAEFDADTGEMIPWDEVRRRVSARLRSDD